MKILIIEDEPFAQQELMRLLKQTGRAFEVLACLDTIEESVAWFQQNPSPDLVFLDIQLADGISFDIFRKVKVKVPVIFTTAYDEYAIKAFQLNSIDYLLKPVRLEELEKSLEKLEEISESFAPSSPGITEEQLTSFMELVSGKEYKQRFMVRIGDQLKSIEMEDIAYFLAEDNVVFLLTKDGKRYIIEQTLENLERVVNPKQFFRINRSFLVSAGSIRKASKYFNSRLILELAPEPDEKPLVSRKKVQDFMKWMDQ